MSKRKTFVISILMFVFLLLMAVEVFALITIAVPWSLKVSSAFCRVGWAHISTTNFCLSRIWISTYTAGKESVFHYALTTGGGGIVQWIGIYFQPVILFVTLGKTFWISASVSVSSFPPVLLCLFNSEPFQARTMSHQVFVSHIAKCFILFSWAYRCCCNINYIYFFILLP